ncbi:unnamed protein product [Phytophthora lilii]|uniref:RxLR effector protein n=1 Tax=Phytophthora lilii TaxID=2077276 RepID=A0A9W6TSD4_9STRA|nr:unnamed protein product [Phytophthora lilii]
MRLGFFLTLLVTVLAAVCTAEEATQISNAVSDSVAKLANSGDISSRFLKGSNEDRKELVDERGWQSALAKLKTVNTKIADKVIKLKNLGAARVNGLMNKLKGEGKLKSWRNQFSKLEAEGKTKGLREGQVVKITEKVTKETVDNPSSLTTFQQSMVAIFGSALILLIAAGVLLMIQVLSQ